MNDPKQYDLDDLDTSRTLKTLAERFNLPSVYTAITPEQWANPTEFLATLPPMPQALADFLAGPCPINAKKKAAETHIVVPLVKNIITCVNGVSTTVPRSLKALDKLDKDAGGKGCKCNWEFLEPIADKPAEVEFEWAVMTREMIPKA